MSDQGSVELALIMKKKERKKEWPFEVSPYVCIGSHAFAMFPPTRYVRGGATRAHRFDDLYPIWPKLDYSQPACIAWLY